MNYSFRKLLVMIAFAACGSTTYAQLPNEKFGKPSEVEWNYKGWGDAIDDDAIVLCKTMTVSYELSEQFGGVIEGVNELNTDNMQSLGKNMVTMEGIVVNHDFKLRIKILKPEGAKHANIDITYQDAKEVSHDNIDELLDLKVRVFSKNEKGKVVKRNVNVSDFVKERINDTYKVVHVVVPDVKADDIIEYTYKVRSPRPSFLYDWSFQEAIPVVHSKCDIEIPAFLTFDMNVPINTKLVKSKVEAGYLMYDTNRKDMKTPKKCRTNHYTIVGDNILPEGHALTRNQGGVEGNAEVKIANFTSKIKNEGVPAPVELPQGTTHLKIK